MAILYQASRSCASSLFGPKFFSYSFPVDQAFHSFFDHKSVFSSTSLSLLLLLHFWLHEYEMSIRTISSLLFGASALVASLPVSEKRTVAALNQAAFQEAQQRDATATRAFSSVAIKVRCPAW